MPKLNKTGPEKQGPKTGRKLGKCNVDEKSDYELGMGMGKKRKVNNNSLGKGKRFQTNRNLNN